MGIIKKHPAKTDSQIVVREDWADSEYTMGSVVSEFAVRPTAPCFFDTPTPSGYMAYQQNSATFYPEGPSMGHYLPYQCGGVAAVQPGNWSLAVSVGHYASIAKGSLIFASFNSANSASSGSIGVRYRSSNFGDTVDAQDRWWPVYAESCGAQDACLTKNGDMLLVYFGNSTRIFKVPNVSYSSSAPTIPIASLSSMGYHLRFFPCKDSLVLIGGNGIRVSMDDGVTWGDTSYLPVSIAGFTEYAKGRYLATSYTKDIYRSIDYGETWEGVFNFGSLGISCGTNTGGNAPAITGICSAGGAVYAIFDHAKANSADSCGIYKSVDQGETWSKILAIAPSTSDARSADNLVHIGGGRILFRKRASNGSASNAGNVWCNWDLS